LRDEIAIILVITNLWYIQNMLNIINYIVLNLRKMCSHFR